MNGRFGLNASKKRAVENALHRLGMQAKNEEVIAALAHQGIGVSQGFVRLVRFDLLKVADRLRVRSAQPHPHNKRPQARRRTTPAPRTCR